MTQILKTDVLIFGGGVAGLWLLNRLRSAGYSAWLMEKDALGAGQSIASQGMIHGGIKYALGGKLTNASTTIADMPSHWSNCLTGEGDVDLRGCNLLSDAYYMWPGNSLRSRLNAFLGSKALEARVNKVDAADYPVFFRDNIPGPLYRLQDIVFDVPSLLQTLADRQKDSIFKIDWDKATLAKDESDQISGLVFENGTRIEARQYIFCCGAGTQDLMENTDMKAARMQRRPLQMVMVKHNIADPLYVHCVSDKLTMTPEVTITSHLNGKGEPVWYLGGEIAERGTNQSEGELIDSARLKLKQLFPWVSFDNASWAGLPIDRAEEQQAGGGRPDTETITEKGNLMVCWPTKLTLSPSLANQVIARIQARDLQPSGELPAESPDFLERPVVAKTPWEHL